MFRVLEILEPMFQIGLPAASELLTHIRRHWVNKRREVMCPDHYNDHQDYHTTQTLLLLAWEYTS